MKSYFANTRLGFRMALSVSGKGTGFRGDAVIVDDPLNAREAWSKPAREEVIFWWDLLDQVRARMSFVETKAALKALAAKWPQARAKLIEDKANGPAIINELQDTVEGLIPVEPDGSKEARARAVSPLIEAGNIWLPEDAPWLSDFLTEHAAFPKGANDDQVDAISQALRRWTMREEKTAADYWAQYAQNEQ